MEPATRLTPDQIADLLRTHEDMVWKIAGDIYRKWPACDIDDVAGAVRLGFVRAASMFDPSLGWKFSTYAWSSGWREGMKFLHAEAARGMHVPESHPRWHAPPTLCVYEEAVADGRGPDRRDPDAEFWAEVCRPLTPRERAVVLGVYRDGKTQVDVAGELGITRSRCQQNVATALAKLRKWNDLTGKLEDAA